VSICAALILAAAAFADSAEARQGFGGGRGVSGFSGRGMSGFSGRGMSGFSGRSMSGFSGRSMSGFSPRAMSVAGPGPARFARPVGMGPGRVAWAGRGNWSGNRWAGNWSGNRWAGNWRGGHWRGGRFWPWWGVGAGVALAAAWPYYGGYGYGYDSCVQWVARLWLGERLQLSVLWRLRLLLITNYLTLFEGPPKVAPLASNSSRFQKLPSITRVAAAAFGFLVLSHALDGPDLYGASSIFGTMPSRPSLQTALNSSTPWSSLCSTYWMPPQFFLARCATRVSRWVPYFCLIWGGVFKLSCRARGAFDVDHAVYCCLDPCCHIERTCNR
jgi:hypothetical protein